MNAQSRSAPLDWSIARAMPSLSCMTLQLSEEAAVHASSRPTASLLVSTISSMKMPPFC